ncbi:MAG: phosphate signaling complex protein PhoU [Myxococcota bacterium]
MLHTPHLDVVYEKELTQVARHLDEMADLAEAMVRDAALALLSRDERLAAEVIASDERLDDLEIAADHLCVALMAKRAPVGRDLRLCTATLKMVTDLERIGDLAVNIVRRVGDLGEPPLPDEVASLAKSVVEELGIALRALRSRDAALARRLRDHDADTDEYNRAAFQRVIGMAEAQSKPGFEKLLATTSVCRHLERIGDHSVNLAEMVVYLVEGQTLRHQPG